jgi:hypothetical protein
MELGRGRSSSQKRGKVNRGDYRGRLEADEQSEV